jgi:phosphohistidine phosphatase
MDLILWRHADAVDGLPDLDRRLTAKGLAQAQAMADWLRPRLPKQWRLISSPALRARQTAEALSEEMTIVREIAPGASYASVLAAAGWPDAGGTVVVVGHQPTLGETAAALLAGQELPWSVRKVAIWWLSHRVRHEDAQVVLRAVVSPELL